MNPSPDAWVEHARRRPDDARYLLDDGRTATAAVQVYYALYYACRALLEVEGFSSQLRDEQRWTRDALSAPAQYQLSVRHAVLAGAVRLRTLHAGW